MEIAMYIGVIAPFVVFGVLVYLLFFVEPKSPK